LHALISGTVQGVFFRAGAQEEALRLGLTGFVMNRPDGSVELVAEGERKALEDLLSWCLRGPSGAVVRDVEFVWEEAQGAFSDFEIKRD